LIPSHRGSVNGRLIVHLPLIVPENCGYLRVGEDQRSWEEGKLLIFDDTFDHEARNDSDQTRVVLIFDIWNPQLSQAERDAFRRILATAADFEKRLLEH
jgi:aspartyl/asparaginyl beta-hydroxylase (cupin superfamily)